MHQLVLDYYLLGLCDYVLNDNTEINWSYCNMKTPLLLNEEKYASDFILNSATNHVIFKLLKFFHPRYIFKDLRGT